MFINNNVPVNLNFKGVAPEVMKNFGKLDRGVRMSIAEHYNILEKAKNVDLIMNGEKNIAIKIKQTLQDLVNGVLDLKEGTVLKISGMTDAKVKGSKLEISNLANVTENKPIDLVLNFCAAEDALNVAKKIELNCGSSCEPKIPALGSIIEVFENLRPLIEQKNKVLSDLIK